MASYYGIKVIRINSDKSEKDYLRNEILNSSLNDIYNLGQIDYNEAEKFAIKNICYEICKYYDYHKNYTCTDLSSVFGLCTDTIYRYLRKGAENGFCTFDGRSNSINALKSNRRTRPVVQLNKNMEVLKIYNSILDASTETKVNYSSIGSCCRHVYSCAGGYVWRYLEEVKEYIDKIA